MTLPEKMQADLARLQDMFGNEPLHADLAKYVEFSETLQAQCLRHPLVYSIFYSETLNKFLNKQYAQKLGALAEAKKQKAWSTFIHLHERPWRFDAFRQIEHNLSSREYWKLVRNVWMDCENVHQNFNGWRDVWMAEMANRQSVMHKDEARQLAQMGEVVEVFRGANTEEHASVGFSWTTDRERAEWFAQRYAGQGVGAFLAHGVVAKSHVIALLLARNENEIVVPPEAVTVVDVRRIRRRRL